jgi:hypothetical protein
MIIMCVCVYARAHVREPVCALIVTGYCCGVISYKASDALQKCGRVLEPKRKQLDEPEPGVCSSVGRVACTHGVGDFHPRTSAAGARTPATGLEAPLLNVESEVSRVKCATSVLTTS